MTELLNRKELPPFVKIKSFYYPVDKIIEDCKTHGLLNADNFNDYTPGKSNVPELMALYREFRAKYFDVRDDNADFHLYKQHYLTRLRSNISSTETLENGNEPSASKKRRRLIKDSKDYNPALDELNYGEFTEEISPLMKAFLNTFKDNLARVRLAYLGPHFSVKPHVDHDPSYIVRYHFPLLTNEKCLFHVMDREGKTHTLHMPADGHLYFINAGLKHWAENTSDQWRLHLIIDVHGQDLLRQSL